MIPFIAIVFFGVGTCSNGSTAPIASPGPPDDQHGLHIVNSERLRAVMEELRELDLDRRARRADSGEMPENMERVSRLAAALSKDARLIPHLFKNNEMSDESRRVFDRLATQMERQCLDLVEVSERSDTTAVGTKLSEIIATCNACHASFRGPVLAATLR
jgi:cytochrome c556